MPPPLDRFLAHQYMNERQVTATKVEHLRDSSRAVDAGAAGGRRRPVSCSSGVTLAVWAEELV